MPGYARVLKVQKQFMSLSRATSMKTRSALIHLHNYETNLANGPNEITGEE